MRGAVAVPGAPGRLQLVARFAILLAGLTTFATGIVLTLQSGLGLGPWDTLHQGLSFRLPVTIGQAGIGAGVLLLVVTILLGERVGPGTLLNILVVGLVIDAVLWSGLVPDLSRRHVLSQFAMDAAGILTMGLGSGMYIKAGLGAGPRDSLMLALTRLSGWRVGVVRALIEGAVLLLGWLLGGTVGVGTLVFVLGIGPAVELGFRVFGVSCRAPHTEVATPSPP